MTNVAVTCIKNGRADMFGRPLIEGTYYPSIEREHARSLWNAGYVSVADAAVFDDDPLAGTSPLDDFNIARALSLSRQPAQTSANLAAELAAIGITAPDYGIGSPLSPGYGVGVYRGTLPAGWSAVYGANDPTAPTKGNYLTPDGSSMVWIPSFMWKWGTGTNGLAVNECAIADASRFQSIQHANSLGFASLRSMIDGGQSKQGYFIDKYLCSNNSGVASSILGRQPLSSSASHNPISALNGSPANSMGGCIAAARTRGAGFFAATRAMRFDLAVLAYARARAITNASICDWYDATNNFPKGNNNNALGDSNDGALSFTSDGFPNASLTGSGVPFNKTTHNGEASGVCDVNGSMWEVTPGLTSDGTNFFILNQSATMANMTGGNTLSTDLWGAAGLAANYTNIGATYGSLTASSSTKLFGNAAQVFSEAQSGTAWEMACMGIPLLAGTGGTNAFGNDSLADYRLAELSGASGGGWGNTTGAGIWAFMNQFSQAFGSTSIGFRCAYYP